MKLADEILTLTHAFDDPGRKEAVRALASKVAQLEADVVFHKRNADGNWRDLKETGSRLHAALSKTCGQRDAFEIRAAKAEELADRYARQLTEARSFILSDEERRKLTGDALSAERACVEKDARIAEMSRRIDELTSWHDDERTWRVGAEQERDDAMQRVRALEDDCETAGAALGAVCILATVAVGTKYAGPTDHAAVAAAVAILGQRDAVAVAAKEYLMRSVPDPNVGVDAEDTLRGILADLGAEE